MSNENTTQPNTVTYWESRQINIGDYENISFGATYGLKIIEINRRDKKVEISSAQSAAVYQSITIEDAFSVAVEKVHGILNAREKEIRLMSQINGGTAFNTAQKGIDFNIIKPEDLVKKEKINTGFIEEKPARKFKDEDFDDLFDDEPVTKKQKKSTFFLVNKTACTSKRGKNLDTDIGEDSAFDFDEDEQVPF